MDTSEINKSLSKCKSFKGTYPSDFLPAPIHFPSSYVVNTDTSKKKGEHWVAIAFNKAGDLYYFDSFGFPPLTPELRKYINRTCKKNFIYNSQTLQHPDSKSCGLFVIDFIKKLDAGHSYESFIGQFSKVLQLNEDKIWKT